MDKIKKFDLNKLLTLLVSFMLVFTMMFAMACDKGSDDSTNSSNSSAKEETTAVTDYQTVKNGDFQFGTDDEDDTYPVYTGINWTRYRDNSYSSSAISSTKNSGIIDTADAAYDELSAVNKPAKAEGEDKHFNPHTPEYYGLVKDSEKYVYNEETAEENPNEDGLVTSGSKILMIHNVTSEATRGTAQKFTSSTSLTSSTGYGKITVWVLTKDLKTMQNTKEFGAYISVAGTTTSTRSPLVLKNINTNGNWAQYTIYVESSAYATSKFIITLGLGFGSDTYMAEYVEGFAYFDNVHFEEVEQQEYVDATAALDTYSIFELDGTEKDAAELKVNQANVNFAANGDKKDAFDQTNYDNTTKVEVAYTHKLPSTAVPFSAITWTGEYNDSFAHGQYNEGAKYGNDTFANVKASLTTDHAGLNANALTHPQSDSAEVFYLNLTKLASYTLTSGAFEAENNSFTQVSMNTNVNVAIGQTGATIEVEEYSNGKWNSVATVASNYTTYSTDEGVSEWNDVSIFLKNTTGAKVQYRIKLTLGATDTQFEEANKSLSKGYALLTNVATTTLTESEFDAVSSSADYKSTITLGNSQYPNGPEEDEDEDENYYFNTSSAYEGAIQTNLAHTVIGYTGVVAGHSMVGGTGSAYYSSNVVSGLANTKYIDTYTDLIAAEQEAVKALANGENIQPLVIKNNAQASYGYLGSALTFAANSTTLVSVQVKVLDNATATVYLVNADPLSGFHGLTVADNDENDHALKVSVTNNTAPSADDKWVTVNFVVTTGDEDITYRVELWNGTRDGSLNSEGTVVFGKVSSENFSTASVNALKAKLTADFVATGADVESYQHTRANTEVTYTDENGKEATYNRTYAPKTVFTNYVKGSTIIASYETIHAPLTVDETTSTETDEEDSTTESEDDAATAQPETSWTLQIISIVVAAALIVVLAVVVIRQIVKKNKKANVSAKSYYNRNSRESAQAIIAANKAKREAKQNEEAAYDYENPENNV